MITRFFAISTLLLLMAQPASAGGLACWTRKIHQMLTVQRPKTETIVRNLMVSDNTGAQKANPIAQVEVKVEPPKPPAVDRRKLKLEGYGRRKEDAVFPAEESADEGYRHPAPGLVGDPYSPEEVQKRHEMFAKKFGMPDPVQPGGAHSIREFIGSSQKNYYHDWFEKLDHANQQRVIARIERIKYGDKGDVRPLTGGVFELRLFFGPGYRIYFAEEGKTGVVLLKAGEKSTQSTDIKEATRLREELTSIKPP